MTAGPFTFLAARMLYRYAYFAYRPLYYRFKRRQDAAELAFLERWVRPGDVALDIGANVGFYTRFLSDRVGASGVVHAFEPDPLNFRHLAEGTRGCANVRLNHMAVADGPGEIGVHRSALLNVDHRTYSTGAAPPDAFVRADSIDHYLENVQRIDIVKVDIQGFEMTAFRGMQATLAANRDVVVLTEIYPAGLAAAGSSVAEVGDFLAGLGFACHGFEGGTLRRLANHELPQLDLADPERVENVVIARVDASLLNRGRPP